MNFFDDRNLALRIKNNEVSSDEKFYYLLINFILFCIFSSESISSQIFTSHTLTTHQILKDIIGSTFAILGVIICYLTNKKGDNQNFIERLVILSIPIMVRTLVFGITITFTMEVINFIFNTVIFNINLFEPIIEIYLFNIYPYFRLQKAIKIASC